MKDCNELRRRRGVIIKDMRALTDLAEAEKRELTAEESGPATPAWNRTRRSSAPRSSARSDSSARPRARVFRQGARAGCRGPSRARRRTPTPAPRRSTGRSSPTCSARGYRPAEHRALQADSQIGGGYLVAPEQFINQLIEALRDQVFIRQFSTVIPVQKATSLGVPVLQARPDDADWTVELKTGSADTAMSFAKRELHPHPAAKRILVSTFLLNNAVLPVDQIVRDQLAYKFGITQEKAFLLGSGSGQPLGRLHREPERDRHRPRRLDRQHHHRDRGRRPDQRQVRPQGPVPEDRALDLPPRRRQRHPQAQGRRRPVPVAAGARRRQARHDPGPAVLHFRVRPEHLHHRASTRASSGDFSFYWIADSMEFSIQVLKELYAESNQIGYIGRMECDAQPVLSEAFVRVKLA